MKLYRVELVHVLHIDVTSTSQDLAEIEARRIAAGLPAVQTRDIVSCTAVALPSEDDRARWQTLMAVGDGTPSQRQRYACGVLPEEELLTIVRRELWVPFVAFEQRRRMSAWSIPHPKSSDGSVRCAAASVREGIGDTPSTTWRTRNLDGTMTDGEWRAVNVMRDAANEIGRHPWMCGTSPRLTLHETIGTCDLCSGRVSSRFARVELDWAGRTLSKELEVRTGSENQGESR